MTVTMYSTPYATAEQTGITESMSGACRVVTTTRTRTFPDGHTENDTFRRPVPAGRGPDLLTVCATRVVVGAGPAGAAAAIALGPRRAADVVMVDKARSRGTRSAATA